MWIDQIPTWVLNFCDFLIIFTRPKKLPPIPQPKFSLSNWANFPTPAPPPKQRQRETPPPPTGRNHGFAQGRPKAVATQLASVASQALQGGVLWKFLRSQKDLGFIFTPICTNQDFNGSCFVQGFGSLC